MIFGLQSIAAGALVLRGFQSVKEFLLLAMLMGICMFMTKWALNAHGIWTSRFYFELINFLLYIQYKDGNTDWAFPTIKDQSQLLISHAKSSKVSQATWYLLLRNYIDIAMYIVYFNMGH